MNGAEALIATLVQSGIDLCFANPGTSEMQLVAAIDRVPGMRPVLALDEGVVTGAADGYARMAGKPASAQSGGAVSCAAPGMPPTRCPRR